MAKKVEIILVKEQPKLGHKGKLVTVPLGYARNYLIPQGIAVLATKDNLKRLEQQKTLVEQEHQQYLEKQKPLAEKLNQAVIIIKAKAQENGSLFGSIGTEEISAAINKKYEASVKSGMVELEKPLKKTGSYKIQIKFTPELTCTTTVEIKPED